MSTRSFTRNVLAFALSLGLAVALPAAAAPETAQSPKPAAAAPAASTASSSHVPLLWKVSDNDNSLYLLGSIHVLKTSDYPLSADVDAAFADAEHVMFETDLDALKSPETAALFLKHANFEDGRKLGDVMPAEAMQKLDTVLKAGGGSLAQVEGLEPWALNISITLGIVQALGFSTDAGVDLHIAGRAKAAGKPITWLESPEDQLRALGNAPMQEQVDGLVKFLDDPSRTVTDIRELHRDWLNGDIEAMDREMRVRMAEESPVGYRLLNVDRNNAWMPKLEARLKDHGSDDTLAVVGALHLMGADGVIEKLRAKGYTVERVCTACDAAKAQ